MKEMAAIPLPSWEMATTKIPTTEETHAAVPASGIRALMLAVLDDAMHRLIAEPCACRGGALDHQLRPLLRVFVRGHL
jgi:hypothetical protein